MGLLWLLTGDIEMGERNEASGMRSVLTVLEYLFVIDDRNTQKLGYRATGFNAVGFEDALNAPS